MVTGGFGFIGGYLIDLLTENDLSCHVHVVDNLSTNPIDHTMLLDEIGNRPNLTFEICSIEEFYKQRNNTKWDEIYHLASVVGPAGVLKYAGNIVKSVVEDTYYMAEIAIKCGARLLDISTSEVYGGGQEGLCDENFDKIIPAKTTVRLEYAVAKLAAETALINMVKTNKIDSVIVRPFNISGPRQSGAGGFVVPRFVACAILNKPLTIFGTGKQIRAFTHVRDIATGLVSIMKKGKSGEAYNIGNPNNKITINGLADIIISTTKSKSEKSYIDGKSIYGPLYEESNDKFPNAHKSLNELKWTPAYGIEQVVEETSTYMKNIDKHTFEKLSGK